MIEKRHSLALETPKAINNPPNGLLKKCTPVAEQNSSRGNKKTKEVVFALETH